MNVIAVDWSGAVKGSRRKIWLAEAHDGRLVRLESGRDREELTAHLVDFARAQPETVVGLDFAFSLPAWFMRSEGFSSAPALWLASSSRCPQWLGCQAPPFWGKTGTTRPALEQHFRRTELEVLPVAGIRPKSVFQVNGAGTVGTGSLRGMACLATLHSAGFAVWPFQEPAFPLVVEIYPRLLTGAVKKSAQQGREAFLRSRWPELAPRFGGAAASSDDAFDAAVSALVMSGHVDDLRSLRKSTDEEILLEGQIWTPSV